MFDVANFLFEHAGISALAIILGLSLDYFSGPRLRESTVKWLRDGQIPRLSGLLNGFLKGFIYPVLTSTFFTSIFFRRSAIVSVCFLILVILLQVILGRTGAIDQFSFIAPTPFTIGGAVLGLICINFVIDYLSNIQSVVLLRMAATTGRLIDVVVSFYSDIILTIAIFTFLFPIAVVFVSVVVMKYPAPMIVDFHVEGAWPKGPGEEALETDAFLEKTRNYSVALKERRDRDELQGFGIVIRAIDADAARGALISTLLREFPGTRIVEPPKAEIFSMEVQLTRQRFNFRDIIGMYTNAYRQANITREGFGEIVRLDPLYVSVGKTLVSDSTYADRDAVYSCNDKTLEYVVVGPTSPKDSFGRGVSHNAAPNCEASAVVVVSREGGVWGTFRDTYAKQFYVPITPFAMTSFAVSALYYAAIFVCVAAVGFVRAVGLATAIPFDWESRVFTLIGSIAFAIIFTTSATLRALTSLL